MVATHDAVSQLYPGLFPLSVRLFYNRLYSWSARRAAMVVTGSEASRQDIVRAWRVPAERVRVVHHAPDARFKPLADHSASEAARRSYLGSDAPFFLFVGKISGRRSLPPLYQAFAEFKRRTRSRHKLLLVGLNPRRIDLGRLAAEADVTGDVVYSGYLPDADLHLLYDACQATPARPW